MPNTKQSLHQARRRLCGQDPGRFGQLSVMVLPMRYTACRVSMRKAEKLGMGQKHFIRSYSHFSLMSLIYTSLKHHLSPNTQH